MTRPQDDLDEKLRSAIFLRQHAKARELLAMGANPNACNEMKWSSLHIAAHLNSVRTAFLLLRHGADDSLRERHGCTPLMLANERGHDSMVSLLTRAAEIRAHTEKLRAAAKEKAKGPAQKKYRITPVRKFNL